MSISSPAELRDGIESLEYWRARGKRLAWYRVRARREAREMSARWERRVRAAVIAQPGIPLLTRVSAGLVIGRLWLERLPLRRALIVAGTVVTVVVMVPLIAFTVLLTQIF